MWDHDPMICINEMSVSDETSIRFHSKTRTHNICSRIGKVSKTVGSEDQNISAKATPVL